MTVKIPAGIGGLKIRFGERKESREIIQMRCLLVDMSVLTLFRQFVPSPAPIRYSVMVGTRPD